MLWCREFLRLAFCIARWIDILIPLLSYSFFGLWVQFSSFVPISASSVVRCYSLPLSSVKSSFISFSVCMNHVLFNNFDKYFVCQTVIIPYWSHARKNYSLRLRVCALCSLYFHRFLCLIVACLIFFLDRVCFEMFFLIYRDLLSCTFSHDSYCPKPQVSLLYCNA